MSKFNLKDYQKINGDEHIDMRLQKDHSDVSEVINQKQLEDYRVNKDKDVTVEKLLDAKRLGASDEITEKRLDTDKGMFKNKYRNSEAYEGDINKLEEKRLKGEKTEDEKYEPASSTPKYARWWEGVKSPDGLKIAKKMLKAQADDVDEELDFGGERWKDIKDYDEDPLSAPKAVDNRSVDPIEYPNENVSDILPEDDFAIKGEEDLKILKQKDITNPDVPGANGVYMVLSYDPDAFEGNSEAIKNAAYEKVVSLRPELEGVISSDDFGDIEENEGTGTIKLRKIGEEIYNVFQSKSQEGANLTNDTELSPESIGSAEDSGIFEESTYKEKDIGGTSMAVGKIITDIDISPENKESVLQDAVKFISQRHPGIDIDVGALDLTKLDKGEISFMVAVPMAGSSKGEISEEINEPSIGNEITNNEDLEIGDVSDEELEKLLNDEIEGKGDYAPLPGEPGYIEEHYPEDELVGEEQESGQPLEASSDFEIIVKADSKKK